MRNHWLICLLIAASALGATAVAIAADGPPAVEVHGWALTRYYGRTTVDANRDSSGVMSDEEKDSHLEWERFSLYAKARLDEGREAYAEVYIHPWLPQDDPSFLYLESLYLDVPVGPGAKVRIGKGRNTAFGLVPTYGNRKTSNYNPLSETFTMDRVLGIQLIQKLGNDTLNVGLFDSQRPGARLIGMAADSQLDRGSVARTTVMNLANRDTPANRSGQLDLNARYGRQSGPLNAGVSGRIGALDETDSAFLASRFATYNGTNRTRLHYGLDASYRAAPIFGSAELYAGTLGGIRNSGYALVAGVEPSKDCPPPLRELSSVCRGVYVRYVKLDIGVPAEVNNSLTWDTTQWAVSYVLPIRTKYFPLAKWLQFEYERNREKVPAGADQIPNDMFFVELFSAF